MYYEYTYMYMYMYKICTTTRAPINYMHVWYPVADNCTTVVANQGGSKIAPSEGSIMRTDRGSRFKHESPCTRLLSALEHRCGRPFAAQAVSERG